MNCTHDCCPSSLGSLFWNLFMLEKHPLPALKSNTFILYLAQRAPKVVTTSRFIFRPLSSLTCFCFVFFSFLSFLLFCFGISDCSTVQRCFRKEKKKKKKNLPIQESLDFFLQGDSAFWTLGPWFLFLFTLHMLQSTARVGTPVLCVLSCVWTGQRACTHTHVQSVCRRIAS